MPEFYIDKVYNSVREGLTDLQSETESYRSAFEAAAEALAGAELPDVSDMPTYDGAKSVSSSITAPTTVVDPAPDLEPIAFEPVQFPQDLDVATDLAGIETSVPEFDTSVGQIELPAKPAPIDTSGKPFAPNIGTPTYPAAPSSATPSLPAMTEITIPTFVYPTLPTFDVTAPELDATPPAAVVAWSEPEYRSELYDQVKLKIQEMMGGQSGLPPHVELALYDRARAREDLNGVKARQEAVDTFASRGYSMPPGWLVAQVNAIIEENQLKNNATNRDIMIRTHEVLIQQLNHAITTVTALENLTINLHNNVQNRRLEIEKARLEQAIAIFNAMVQAFNVRTQAYGVAANVFKIKVDAELAKLEAYKVQIQGLQLVGQLNEQKVRIYTAQLEALRNQVEIYKASVEAARSRMEGEKLRIDIFRAQIDAWAAGLQAEKVRFDAYKAEIDAEASKATIISAEAQAYTARMKGIELIAQLNLKKVDAKLESAKINNQLTIANLEAEKVRMNSQSQVFSQKSENFRNQISKVNAEFGMEAAKAGFDLKKAEAELSVGVQLYQAEIAKYNALSDKMIKLAELNRESLKVMAQYSAQLAAGALSARNYSMSVTGSGQGGEQWNKNWNYNYSM